MCGGVRGRARQRAQSAERGGAASAAQHPQRRPGRAARRWVGRVASPPAGSPLAACRPPSARKAARSRGAAPEQERESPAEPTPDGRAGSAPPLAASLRSRGRPACPRRWRLPSTNDSAPERPGQLPGARVSGRSPLPVSSRAPPPAFAFTAAARRGWPGQRPGQPGRPRRGTLD